MPALRHRAAHFLLNKAGFFDRKYDECIAGETFVVPIINGRKTYASEPWMAQVIRKLFEIAEGSFIDVGVNLGQTLLKVAAADRNRPYVGFEPNPACADYAFELIRANNLPFAVVPAALASKTGITQLQMYRAEPTDPSASLVEGFRNEAMQTKPVVTLSPEDLPPEIFAGPIAVIKIDVEGGEAEVLRAVAPHLGPDGPFVLMEILPYSNFNSTQRLQNQQELEHLLRSRGYLMFRIIRDGEEKCRRLDQIDEIGTHSDLALCDYIMAPSGRAKQLQRVFSIGSS